MGRKRILRPDSEEPDTFNLRLRKGYRAKLEALADKDGTTQTQVIHNGIDALLGVNTPKDDPTFIHDMRHHNFSDELRNGPFLALCLTDPNVFLRIHNHDSDIRSRATDPEKKTLILIKDNLPASPYDPIINLAFESDWKGLFWLGYRENWDAPELTVATYEVAYASLHQYSSMAPNTDEPYALHGLKWRKARTASDMPSRLVWWVVFAQEMRNANDYRVKPEHNYRSHKSRHDLIYK